MSASTCCNYAGGGKCKFSASKACSYHTGKFICSVNGDLEGKNKAKTVKERDDYQPSYYKPPFGGLENIQ